MRRTQLYLDEDLWSVLRVRARDAGTTVSELLRQAVRERYLGKLDERRKAMQGFVGSRRRSAGEPDAPEQVRSLRRGERIRRFGRQ